MTTPVWIAKKALLLLHEKSLAQFGGAPGLRDEGLLDSALARAQNAHAYRLEATIAELAAACAIGLLKNHPFVDGNKRAALLSIGLMLFVNGYRLTAHPADAVLTMVGAASGELDEAHLAAWIEKNSAAR